MQTTTINIKDDWLKVQNSHFIITDKLNVYPAQAVNGVELYDFTRSLFAKLPKHMQMKNRMPESMTECISFLTLLSYKCQPINNQ